jgi:hypothetical protein
MSFPFVSRRWIPWLVLLLLSCAPPTLLMESVTPSRDGRAAAKYRNLTARDVEILFVRPFTERTLLETSGTTSAMLYDYAYLSKWVGEKEGADEALAAMKEKYIDQGISFRILVWGERVHDVDLSRWRFRLRTKDGDVYDPSRFESIGGPEFEHERVDRRPDWRNLAEATFPVPYEPPLAAVTLEAYKDDEKIQQHTWKFSWE